MSVLIKSGTAEVRNVLPLGGTTLPPRARQHAPDPRDAEIAQLRTEIDRLAGLLAEVPRSERLAREHGRKAGLAEAADREEARLDALRDGLADAAERFQVQLTLLDGLAPQLARAALEKLFAPAESWSAMAEAMISRQLKELRRSAVVALSVSPADFDEARAVALGGGQLRVELDQDLPAGTARIECKLGQIDLDLREQWQSLAALLQAMSAEPA